MCRPSLLGTHSTIPIHPKFRNPVVRPAHRAGGQQQAPAPATLMNWPCDLYVLWQEYQHGIGGRKAARLFTLSERGRVKFKSTEIETVHEDVASRCKTNNNYY